MHPRQSVLEDMDPGEPVQDIVTAHALQIGESQEHTDFRRQLDGFAHELVY